MKPEFYNYMRAIFMALQEIEANGGKYPGKIKSVYMLANQYAGRKLKKDEFDKIMKMSLEEITNKIMNGEED